MLETNVSTLPASPEATHGKRSRLARRWLIVGLVGLSAFFLYRVVRENWHPVIPGVVYRSGQLGPGSLKSKITRDGLRAIINLRGPNPTLDWYRDERAVASDFGVQHFDFVARSQFAPTAEELRLLVHMLESCEKPVLVHCESGIDRSGPASAVSILLLDEEGSPDKALEQFTVWYGHLPGRAGTHRHKGFIKLYQDWLARTGYDHAGARFREWALTIYERPAELAEPPVLSASKETQ